VQKSWDSHQRSLWANAEPSPKILALSVDKTALTSPTMLGWTGHLGHVARSAIMDATPLARTKPSCVFW
jgi:hypothetical protein